MQSADLAEIEDNDLAQATMSLLERIRPYLTMLAAAIGIAFVGLAAWTLISAQKAAERASAWDACLDAIQTGDSARLNDVAARYPGTAAGTWSQLLLADSALASACQMAFTDKQQAAERFQAAADIYSAVMSRPGGDLATERAMFGLAKSREALGQFEAARRGYETLVAEHPKSPLRELAEERAAALGRPAVAGWYDWFGSRDATVPTAAESSEPASGSTGSAAEILTGTSG